VRRPLPKITVAAPDPVVRAAIEAHGDEILGELNIKALEVRADDAGLVKLSAKANFKVLGKRLGGRMKEIAAAVAELDASAIAAYIEDDGLEVSGEVLRGDDVTIQREVAEGVAAEAAEGITVLLDTKADEALRREGLAREIVNRVQNLRKQADLDVSQPIALTLSCGGELAAAAKDPALAEMIKSETLATSLQVTAPEDGGKGEHTASDRVDDEALHVSLSAR
jgi:isoleucyl-tRNA synthetase